MVDHDRTLSVYSAILITVMLFPYVCLSAQAQNEINFTPADSFLIPNLNGKINFAYNGTFTKASLSNDTWNFDNLRLTNSNPLEKLEVSAQDSNITINSYRTFNTIFTGLLLSYKVEGHGKQTFNIGQPLTEGEWSVLLEDDFMGEGDGWYTTPDATLTITDAESNVTIWYFGFPESFNVDKDSDKPVFSKHSVAIATTIALAITATFGFVIRRKNQQDLSKTNGDKMLSEEQELEPTQIRENT